MFVYLLRQESVPIKEVTTLMRAITSAEARAFRQTVDDREQAELKEAKRLRAVEAERRWARVEIAREDAEREERSQKRAARKKAKLAAENEMANEEGQGTPGPSLKIEKSTTSPRPSPPEAERGKDGADLASCPKLEQGICGRAVPPHPGPLPQAEGDLAAAVVAGNARGKVRVVGEGAAEKGGVSTWQPSVVTEGESAESHAAEAAENRVTPRNAA